MSSFTDDRWNEQCSERSMGLKHVRSHGYCLFCGVNPTAPWPDPKQITGSDLKLLREWSADG